MVNKRIKTVRKYYNINQIKMAEYLSVNQSTYSRYEAGKLEPNNHFLFTFCDFFNINLNWLIKGQGEMLLSKDDSKIISEQGSNSKVMIVKVLSEIPDGNPLSFTDDTLSEIPILTSEVDNSKKYNCYRIKGNNLSPDIIHGDYGIFVETVKIEDCEGKIIVIKTKEDIYVKNQKNYTPNDGDEILGILVWVIRKK